MVSGTSVGRTVLLQTRVEQDREHVHIVLSSRNDTLKTLHTSVPIAAAGNIEPPSGILERNDEGLIKIARSMGLSRSRISDGCWRSSHEEPVVIRPIEDLRLSLWVEIHRGIYTSIELLDLLVNPRDLT